MGLESKIKNFCSKTDSFNCRDDQTGPTTRTTSGGVGAERPVAGGHGGVGANLPTLGNFCDFLENNSHFNAIRSFLEPFERTELKKLKVLRKN